MADPRPSRSAVPVALGIFALGVSASVYLVLAGRAVGPSAFAGLAVQWTLVYTVGTGLFLPFEQEIAREVSRRRTHGDGIGPVLRRSSLAAAGVVAAVAVLVLVTLPWLYDVAYFRTPSLVVGLVLAVAGLGGQYVLRGSFSGAGDFAAYGAIIGVEGLVRTVGSLALYVAGVHAVAPYALLVGLSPVLSVVLLLGRFRRITGSPGTHVAWRDLSRNLTWLLAAALAAQGLANLGPVAVRTLDRSLPSDVVGHFMSGLIVARLPIFAFAVIQVTLLPRLARAVAAGQTQDFRRQLALAVAGTGGLAVLGIGGAYVLGPEVLSLLFGPDFSLPRGQLALMAVATGLYMVSLALQPAVVALGGHRATAVAWLSGITVFLVALALPVDVLDRVVLALVLGGAVTTGVQVVRLAPALRGEHLTASPELDEQPHVEL